MMFNPREAVVTKRGDADEMVELWNELGPAGGAVTPYIPYGSAPDYFAAFANAGAAALDAWPMPLWRGLDAARLPDGRTAPR